MIHVCFLIRRFDFGGAQRQMLELIKTLPREKFRLTVIAFYPGGELSSELEQIKDLRVIYLGKQSRWHVVGFFRTLSREIRSLRPDIIHSYLPMQNIIALGVRFFAAKKSLVVWGLRSSNMHRDQGHDWLQRLTLRLEALLSKYADFIIVNSEAGFQYAIHRGYPQAKLRLIRNGIDALRYRPDIEGRIRIRREWKVNENESLIGLVARIDPVKRHELFLKAASLFVSGHPHTRFVFVGDGKPEYRLALEQQAFALGLTDHLIWGGSRSDMREVYSALDICTLCSEDAEGFPNVVGEAMACGVPCVVSPCGDAHAIVANAGVCIEQGAPSVLAEGWESCLKLDRNLLGSAARNRIVNSFSLERLAQSTSEVLEQLFQNTRTIHG